MLHRKQNDWEPPILAMVATYEDVAQGFYRLDLSSPQDGPVDPDEFRQRVRANFHSVELTYADWRELVYAGNQHDEVRYQAYQSSLCSVSELLGAYLVLTPWLSGLADPRRAEAIEHALILKHQLTSWFRVLHDIPVIPRRDAPTLATLIDRMVLKTSETLGAVSSTVVTWGSPPKDL